MEIERKFIVKDLTNLDLSRYNYKHIIQDYLYKDMFTAIRKRKIIDSDGNLSYTYTLKTNKVGFSVNEIEQNISKKDYINLGINSYFNQIDKTRYIIPYIDGLNIELDVFHGMFDGIIFAEIEFQNELQAKECILPTWFGRDISTLITNSDMATKRAEDVMNILLEHN